MKHMFRLHSFFGFVTSLLIFISLTFSHDASAQQYVANVAKYDHKDGLSNNQLKWVHQDSKGLLWIGTSNGINKYNGKDFQLVVDVDLSRYANPDIFEDSEQNLWVSTGDEDGSHLVFNTINYNFGKRTATEAKVVFRKVNTKINKNSKINWEISDRNAVVLHQELGEIFNLNAQYPTLPKLQINQWIKGREYTWLATDQGLFKIGLKRNFFQRHIYEPQQNLKLGNIPESNIYFYRGIYGGNISSDGAGNIYATTRRKGVIEINSNEAVLEGQAGNFWGSYFDGDRYFWISRFDDILRYDLKTDTKKIFEFPDGGDKAWSFFTDDVGKMWIGCNRNIFYVEKNGDRLIRFDHGFDETKILPIKQKYFIQKDSDGNIWMGATAGLFQLDFDKGITDHYWPGGEGKHQLPVLELRHMHEDEDGIFWIATTTGLIRWDRKTGAYQKFGLEDGFSSEKIYAVYGDGYGYLWMSSENGLMQFSKETFKVKAFQKSDGITHNIFNRNSHHQSNDGTIYFGGYNGVTSFHPRDFKHSFDDHKDAPIILTVANSIKEKDTNPHSKIEDYYFQNKIVVSPGDRFLDMKFELLNYEAFVPGKLEYTIELNNKSNPGEWNAMANNHLQLATLPYGNHTLKVRGKTPFAQKSAQPLSIPILVEKPIYMKFWFYLLLAFICGAAVIYYQRMKAIKNNLRQKELEGIVKKRTEKILTQAVELQELDKAKSQFLENISHEFRTPLTLILNILNKEEIEELDSVEITQGKIFGKTELEILQRNSGRLKLLIDQLLDLSKLEAGKMELQKEMGEIHFHLKGIVQTFKSLAEQKNIELIFTSNAPSTQLMYDRDKMDKIFYNLLSNAIKFSLKGGTIRVDLQNNNDELLISVQDAGVGIPSDQLSKIFERFYQVNRKNKYNYEGTGLGLALVKEFVELHGGKINVSSQQGKGTIFTLFFPVNVNETHQAPAANLITEKLPLPPTGVQFNTAEIPLTTTSASDDLPIVLIIEDNADLRFYHHKALSNKYQLLFAEDGQSGLKTAKKQVPDLIICDVMMPGPNGFELCELLKKDEICNHVPIVLLTARASKADRLTGVAVGADDFMVKPFDQKELNLRIQNLLNQRKVLKTKFAAAEIKLASSPSKYNDPFINKLSRIIDANIRDESFGILELSQAAELSRSQLFRKVKAITGDSPSEFLNKHRLQKAHQLLLDGAGNASEISYQVGFRTPNYFHKCFKAEYGFTPGEIMRSAQG